MLHTTHSNVDLLSYTNVRRFLYKTRRQMEVNVTSMTILIDETSKRSLVWDFNFLPEKNSENSRLIQFI